jgi:uncharacterized membrane protein (GlpM family)
MDATFWYKLGLSFIVGAAWVTLSTLAAERFGSKIGGLIGGLPSTVLVGLLFIGLTQSPFTAIQATTIIPLSQGLNGIFILVYLLAVQLSLVAGLVGSLSVWFLLASLLITTGIDSFALSLVAWMLLVVVCYLAAEYVIRIPSKGSLKVSYSPRQIALRGLFGGAVIALAVLISKVGGPLYGGVFTTFPAMFVTTLAITYRSGGADFSRAVAKSIMISGMINVVLYAIAVRYFYAWFGLPAGTLLAMVISLFTGYLTYLFLKERVK